MPQAPPSSLPSPGNTTGTKPRYRWILLDADGTLFDFAAAETAALSQTLVELGHKLDDRVREVYAQINAELWRQFEAGEVTSERLRVARFEQLLMELGIAREPEGVSDHYLDLLGQQARLLPHAERVVRHLATTCRLVLATNGIASVQRSRFARSTIRDCFEHVVISDEVGVAKPHGRFFAEAFSRMAQPDKSDVLMVGDSLGADILGGVRFGIDTCWVNPRGLAADGEARPTFTIARLPELLSVIAS